LSALSDRGPSAYEDPLTITQDGIVVEGYCLWQLTKLQKRLTILCVVREMSSEQALLYIIDRSCGSKGINDFVRILLALELEPWFKDRAKLPSAKSPTLAKVWTMRPISARSTRLKGSGVHCVDQSPRFVLRNDHQPAFSTSIMYSMNNPCTKTTASTTGEPYSDSRDSIAPTQTTPRARSIANAPDPLKHSAGILVADAMHRRLVEAALIHLELVPVMLEEKALDNGSLYDFELLIADEAVALRIQRDLAGTQEQAENVKPALIAVIGKGSVHTVLTRKIDDPFEGILALPQEPASIVAQLGLVLYAHRAFARKYQPALEELILSRRIFRSVTSGITVSNALLPDLPLIYVNPAFEAITGYSLEEVLGKNCRFLQNGASAQPGLTLFREAIRSGREVVATIRNYRKDGTPFWNELSLSPIRNWEGVLTHFVGIQTDVTARVEFEAALLESEKLAAVGRLAASIAHEINNPLESVMNLIYLARQLGHDGVLREYLAQADKELQRVAHITSQSLRFFKQSTKPDAVRPSGLLDAVLDIYSGRLKNANVRVERRERMTGSIVCMESEIRQVLSNLVRNSFDAMNGSGGRLLVRSRVATEWRTNRKGVVLTFADTGTGIAPETIKHLYTAFFTTKGIGGTGLGLWVSSEIINRHGGRMRVRSCDTPGKSWTVFQLFLPYQGVAV
jgi:two-component system sporulation sensor kinase C